MWLSEYYSSRIKPSFHNRLTGFFLSEVNGHKFPSEPEVYICAFLLTIVKVLSSVLVC